MTQFLHCHMCGKQVSSGFKPIPTEIGEEIVVRAIVICPECIEKEIIFKKDIAS